MHFKDIPGVVLEKVCKYLYYKVKYANTSADVEVPGFDIDANMALELLMAADFLDC